MPGVAPLPGDKPKQHHQCLEGEGRWKGRGRGKREGKEKGKRRRRKGEIHRYLLGK